MRETDNADDLLDELATAKPGEVLILDEVAKLNGHQRKQYQSALEELTPGLMEKRITCLRRQARDYDE